MYLTMARPKKDPKLVKGEQIKIMVTAEQKRRVVAAAGEKDYSVWARDVLLEVVDKALAARSARTDRKKP